MTISSPQDNKGGTAGAENDLGIASPFGSLLFGMLEVLDLCGPLISTITDVLRISALQATARLSGVQDADRLSALVDPAREPAFLEPARISDLECG